MRRFVLLTCYLVAGVFMLFFVVGYSPKVKIKSNPEYFETVYSIVNGDKEFKVVTIKQSLTRIL